MPPRLATLLTRLVLPTAIGAAGGFAFDLLRLPAAWMSGALVAVVLSTFGGLRVEVPLALRQLTFVLLGLIMGSAVTPDTLRLMANWPGSMAGLVLLIPAIIAGIMAYLVLVERWDRTSAFYAAVPGAMSYVMAMSLKSSADMRGVTVVQSVRLIVLVAALPSLIVLMGLGQIRPVAQPPVGALWWEIPALLAASLAAGLAADRIGVPGGATVGAMVASAILHGTGLVVATMPPWVHIIGFVAIGVLIAERFSGTSLRELRALLWPSLAAFMIGTVISIIIAGAVSLAFAIPLGKMVLAYAPGGIEAMAVLAFALDQDPAFVGAHHIVRFVAIAFCLPLMARLFIGAR